MSANTTVIASFKLGREATVLPGCCFPNSLSWDFAVFFSLALKHSSTSSSHLTSQPYSGFDMVGGVGGQVSSTF